MITRKREKHTKELILASLAGLASGTLVGLLFAPNKGDTIRKKMSKKSGQYLGAIRKGKALISNTRWVDSCENWTKEELFEEAKAVGIDGYSKMYNDELILALRNQQRRMG